MFPLAYAGMNPPPRNLDAYSQAPDILCRLSAKVKGGTWCLERCTASSNPPSTCTTTIMSRQDKAVTERHAKTLREMLKRPENKLCADCKRNGEFVRLMRTIVVVG